MVIQPFDLNPIGIIPVCSYNESEGSLETNFLDLAVALELLVEVVLSRATGEVGDVDLRRAWRHRLYLFACEMQWDFILNSRFFSPPFFDPRNSIVPYRNYQARSKILSFAPASPIGIQNPYFFLEYYTKTIHPPTSSRTPSYAWTFNDQPHRLQSQTPSRNGKSL